MPSQQSRWFILTIPFSDWEPVLPDGIQYCRGQQEIGESGYHHWQLVAYTDRKCTVTAVRRIFGGTAHVEPTRSAAALEYVWKEDTRVEGTAFELGEKPVRRNEKADWEEVWSKAKTGDFEAIPANIRVSHYRSLRTIASDFGRTVGMDRRASLFWGRTGTGKSMRAWEEAGLDAYSKGILLLM